MLNPSAAKIAEQLRRVIVSEDSARLQFDEEAVLHEEVGIEFSKRGTIGVVDAQRVLLNYVAMRLPQTVREAVLVNFLDVAVP